MSHPTTTASAQEYFQILEQQGQSSFRQLRHDHVARVLREQRFFRCVRTALAITTSALALTGFAALLVMMN